MRNIYIVFAQASWFDIYIAKKNLTRPTGAVVSMLDRQFKDPGLIPICARPMFRATSIISKYKHFSFGTSETKIDFRKWEQNWRWFESFCFSCATIVEICLRFALFLTSSYPPHKGQYLSRFWDYVTWNKEIALWTNTIKRNKSTYLPTYENMKSIFLSILRYTPEKHLTCK